MRLLQALGLLHQPHSHFWADDSGRSDLSPCMSGAWRVLGGCRKALLAQASCRGMPLTSASSAPASALHAQQSSNRHRRRLKAAPCWEESFVAGQGKGRGGRVRRDGQSSTASMQRAVHFCHTKLDPIRPAFTPVQLPGGCSSSSPNLAAAQPPCADLALLPAATVAGYWQVLAS